MSIIVKKFGGTSVGNLERIKHVTNIIMNTKAKGHDVVVVVSAMSGETDRLIELARQVQAEPNSREYATLVSTGEQVSMALLAMSLHQQGCSARSYTGMQAKILTDSSHKKARILDVDPAPVQAALDAGHVVIVAGFQGFDELGDITTLGRGGSDTTAVALAAALKAQECQIYTDVDGVYTTDPRVVPDARRLDRITFEEMLELSSLGAKVLQIRSVEFAGKYNVPLRVLSSFKEGPGTLITYEEKNVEHPIVSGVAFNRNEAKVSMLAVPDKPGIASRILNEVSAAGIEVDMIIQNIADNGKTDFTFTVHREDYQNTIRILDQVSNEFNAAGVIGNQKIAKLSLVGVGMRSHAGIATKMFQALAAEGINLLLITTSEIKISVVIDEKYLELGVRTLHNAFNLGHEAKEEFDPKAPPIGKS